MGVKKLQSDYAILDVKQGRGKLAKELGNKGFVKPNERIPVTITGHIMGVFGNDDGESQEFSVQVEQVTVHGE